MNIEANYNEKLNIKLYDSRKAFFGSSYSASVYLKKEGETTYEYYDRYNMDALEETGVDITLPYGISGISLGTANSVTASVKTNIQIVVTFLSGENLPTVTDDNTKHRWGMVFPGLILKDGDIYFAYMLSSQSHDKSYAEAYSAFNKVLISQLRWIRKGSSNKYLTRPPEK